MRAQKTLKNIAKVSAATMGSRVLGLIRDQLTFAALGVGAISSAFLFAFSLPNLFRRLMGEGALTSAMVPVLANTLSVGGQQAAFGLLNKIVSRALVVLLIMALLGVLISVAAAMTWEDNFRYLWSGAFSAILFPYIILICLAAVFCGALNVFGVFGIPSIGPMLLNAAMIISLAVGWWIWGAESTRATLLLCGGVIFGGALQMGVPLIWMRFRGWRFSFDFSPSEELSELMRLFLPALLGAAVIQINLMTSKFIAVYLNDTAVSSLYLANRLIELPLGVFTFAIVTVYFPKLAKLNTESLNKSYMAEYRRGLITTMAVTIPAAVGLAALSKDIIRLLFEWGAFGSADVDLCAPILMISAAGIPVFSLAAFATKGFHSCKDTKTPVKVSLLSFAANIALSFALMYPFGARGLAAATVLSSLIPAAVLVRLFKSRKGPSNSTGEVLKCAAASIVMLAAISLAGRFTENFAEGKMLALINCATLIPLGIAVYAAALKLVGFEQMADLRNLVIKKR